MARFPKILALLAALAAACTDKYAPPLAPLDAFYFPVGLAVRPLPSGKSALVVVSTNFDLRYDERRGGTVLSVDPDASLPIGSDGTGGGLAVLGAVEIGSFGGELAWADAVDTGAAWRPPGSYCPELAGDPVLASGGAIVLVASRALLDLYRVDMDAAGGLSLGAGAVVQLPVQFLDPYGVTIACGSPGGVPGAHAYFTHLRGVENQGWLTRLDLRTGEVLPLAVGAGSTYTTTFDPSSGKLYVSTRLAVGNTLRWFDARPEPPVVDGIGLPPLRELSVSAIVTGGLTRDLALSNDGRFLYVSLQLFDAQAFALTGQIITQGGALAAFDLTPTPLNEPRLGLYRLASTCYGGGQIRVLPPRPGRGDLIAVTCDVEGAMAIYDADVEKVVRYVGLDPVLGTPEFGRLPFGLAVEAIDPARAASPASPCGPGRACDRIYVASFEQNVVNIVELDPDDPTGAELVKRIGGVR
jgi:hypothetical protein